MPQNPSHPLRGQHPSNSPFEQVDGSHLSRGPLVENGVGVAGKKNKSLIRSRKTCRQPLGFFPCEITACHMSMPWNIFKKNVVSSPRTVQRYQKTIKQILSTQMKIGAGAKHLQQGVPNNTYVLSWRCLPQHLIWFAHFTVHGVLFWGQIPPPAGWGCGCIPLDFERQPYLHTKSSNDSVFTTPSFSFQYFVRRKAGVHAGFIKSMRSTILR